MAVAWSRSKWAGAGKDAVEVFAAGEMAEFLQRGIELGVAAKAGRLDDLVVDDAADGDGRFAAVDTDVDAVAFVDVKGSVAALADAKDLFVGPFAADQLVLGERLVVVICARAETGRAPGVGGREPPLNFLLRQRLRPRTRRGWWRGHPAFFRPRRVGPEIDRRRRGSGARTICMPVIMNWRVPMIMPMAKVPTAMISTTWMVRPLFSQRSRQTLSHRHAHNVCAQFCRTYACGSATGLTRNDRPRSARRRSRSSAARSAPGPCRG